jgi:hypothetical protein
VTLQHGLELVSCYWEAVEEFDLDRMLEIVEEMNATYAGREMLAAFRRSFAAGELLEDDHAAGYDGRTVRLYR